MSSVTSIVLDGDGHPHIAYADAYSAKLKYGEYNGASWTIATVDTGYSGYYASIALNSSGHPRISHQDPISRDLKFSSFDGSSWNTTLVDAPGLTGMHSSLALDSSGNPRIAYHDFSNVDLRYASFDGAGWSLETVASSGNVGAYLSLALDSVGNPHIVYMDGTNGKTMHAWISSGTDTTAPVITPDVAGTAGSNGWYVSDVNVTWSVTDAESAITSKTGCDATNITTDTAGTTLTCSATSAGGTNSQSVTIKRDATQPIVTVTVIETSGDPELAIDDLVGDVESLVTAGVLKRKQANGLLNPLENALKSLAKDRLADTRNQIADFIVEVEAKTPTPIPESEAQALIDAANLILVLLGSG